MADESLVRQYSEYLSFRSFYTGVEPPNSDDAVQVTTPDDLQKHIVSKVSDLDRPAILLGGGMDAATIVPFVPSHTLAYTIYHEKHATNEVEAAARYCDMFGLKHRTVEISFDDYLSVIDPLTVSKGMPLAPAEPVLHLAAREAVADGCDHIITGGDADAGHGGYPQLRHDLPPDEFENMLRRKYLDPSRVLRQSTSILHVLEKYVTGGAVDSQRFLREIGTQRFACDHAMHAAGAIHVAPYAWVEQNVGACRLAIRVAGGV